MNYSLIEKIANIIKLNVQKLIVLNEDISYVNFSNRRDLGHLQSNIAFILSKKLKDSPINIANKIKDLLLCEEIFKDIKISEPGFINLTINNNFLENNLNNILASKQIELPRKNTKSKIIIDYGGVNIAKAMHVGHLRSAIIGESLKRIFKVLADEVISDIHLGDWGLPMGMLIEELKAINPDWKYFNNNNNIDTIISIEDLENLYPIAAQKCKEDLSKREAARLATKELQNGNKNYLALWNKFLSVSVCDIRKQFDFLDVYFDLWLGESSVNEIITEILEKLKTLHNVYVSDDALIMEVKNDSDKSPVPPVILVTSDETITYATTDIATIDYRVKTYNPDKIMYVVDKRQELHFKQVFRASTMANIIDDQNKLELLGFGTINGLDNKPFKTRDGSAMKLSDLISIVKNKAKSKMHEEDIATKLDSAQQDNIVNMIAIATIKFSDLSHEFKDNYIFDIDQFVKFQGKTGPYILYSAVRIKSIIRNAKEKNLENGQILLKNNFEVELALKIIQFPEILISVYHNRAPHILCEYVYSLSQIFSSFYQNCPIIKENDRLIAQSRLSLSIVTLYYIEQISYLLGIKIPDYM